MNSLFKNLLAAKGPSPDDWIQIIVVAAIVLIGILKAIGGRIKEAMQQKAEQSESQDNLSPPPAKPKKRYVNADGSYKTLEELRDERLAQIREAFGIPQPPEEQEPQPVEQYIETPPPVVEKIEEPPARAVPKPQKTLVEPEHPNIHIAKKAYAHSAMSSKETFHKRFFSSPGDLRRAVLQMEILGKPLALRDM